MALFLMAAFVGFFALSCAQETTPSNSGTGTPAANTVSYKCGCGKTESVAATAPAPSC